MRAAGSSADHSRDESTANFEGLHEMMKAIWRDTILAESEDTIVVEGNHYFPSDSINQDHVIPSATTTVCPWKGTASYHTVIVDGEENVDAAWYYPAPKEAAAEIKNHVAFWRGVAVAENEADL